MSASSPFHLSLLLWQPRKICRDDHHPGLIGNNLNNVRGLDANTVKERQDKFDQDTGLAYFALCDLNVGTKRNLPAFLLGIQMGLAIPAERYPR